MNVVDSSGWLEYFTDGRNADFFAPVIEKPEAVLVPTISLFEVFKRVLLERNKDNYVNTPVWQRYFATIRIACQIVIHYPSVTVTSTNGDQE